MSSRWMVRSSSAGLSMPYSIPNPVRIWSRLSGPSDLACLPILTEILGTTMYEMVQ
jgi:hypothetical protein